MNYEETNQDLLARIKELEQQLAKLQQLVEVGDVNIKFSDICDETVTCSLGTVLTAHKDALITYECWEEGTGLVTGQLVVDKRGGKYGYDIDSHTIKKLGLPRDKRYKVTYEEDYVFFEEVS